jgi:hypothetical protein
VERPHMGDVSKQNIEENIWIYENQNNGRMKKIT